MASKTFTLLVAAFAHYGYGAVFLGSMLENCGLPIPGEATLLFGGLMAHRHLLRLPEVMAAAATGAACGGVIGYLAGLWGITGFLRYVAGGVGIGEKHWTQAASALRRHGAWAIFGARFVIGLRMLEFPIAGALEMPRGPFLVGNICGSVAWAVTMGFAGYVLGSSWERLVHFTRAADMTALAVAVLVVIVILVRRRWERA